MVLNDYLTRGMQKLLVYGNRAYHIAFPKERALKRHMRNALHLLREQEQQTIELRHELRERERMYAAQEGMQAAELARLAQENSAQGARVLDLEEKVRRERPYTALGLGSHIERRTDQPFLILERDTIIYASKDVQSDDPALVGTSYLRLQTNSSYLAHKGETESSRLKIGSRLYLRTKNDTDLPLQGYMLIHLRKKGLLAEVLDRLAIRLRATSERRDIPAPNSEQ